MSSNPKFQFTIPKPCHENWESMEAQGPGKFCGQCQHVVTDFTNMSDTEIMMAVWQAEGKICGRFKRTQLDRDLKPSSPNINPVWPKLVLGSLLLFAVSPHMLLAQTPEMKPAYQTELPSCPDPELQAVSNDTLIKIKVLVLDAKIDRPIPFAEVEVVDLTPRVRTNMEGIAELSLSPQQLDSNFVLRAFAREYDEDEIMIVKDAIPVEVTLRLRMEPMELMGLIEAPRLTRENWKEFKKANRAFIKKNHIKKPVKLPQEG